MYIKIKMTVFIYGIIYLFIWNTAIKWQNNLKTTTLRNKARVTVLDTMSIVTLYSVTSKSIFQ